MRVLVTGATGFVGRTLCPWLEQYGHQVIEGARRAQPGSARRSLLLGDIGDLNVEASDLEGIDAVIHLAARVHRMEDAGDAALDDYRRVNRDGSIALARLAAAAAARRFVFLSTVKVLGERSGTRPLANDDPANPTDAYSRSKWEAEEGLWQVAAETGLEVVVLRPTLVYGPGVGGNVRRALDLVAKGLPLPLGGIDNRRSMLGVGNLCDALQQALQHADTSRQALLLADGDDVSTPAFLRMIGEFMGRPARLLPVPQAALRLAGLLTGRSAQVARLCDSLQVDVAGTRRVLGWQPAFTFRDGLRETVLDYLEQRQRGA